MRRAPDRGWRQRGVALIVALCLLLVLLLIGISAAHMALQGEKAARGDRDRQVAFQAAEEALMDAENDLDGDPAAPGRGAALAPDSAQGFVAGCGAGLGSDNLGLCLSAPDGAAPVWQSVDMADESTAGARSVPFGRFTGAEMATGQGFLPFRRPRYIVELVADAQPGEAADAAPQFLYRVTAIGFGSRASSQVVLQTYYRKRPAPDGADGEGDE